MQGLSEFFGMFPWYACIAIIAITGTTVTSIVRMRHVHEERMEKIKRGMDPGNRHA